MNELFRDKIGLSEYKIEDDLSPEQLAAWKKEIEEIRKVVESADFDLANFESVMKGTQGFTKHLTGRLDKKDLQGQTEKGTYENIKELKETWDEEDKTILAINLWMMREVNHWKGLSAQIRALLGGRFQLSESIDHTGNPNCIDTSVLFSRLAKEYGLSSQIADSPDGSMHYVSQLEGGKISDIWYGWPKGGLFPNKNEYIKFVNGQIIRKVGEKSKI